MEPLFGERVTIKPKRRINLQTPINLETPEGVYGAILGKFHKDSSIFRYLFREYKCVLSPVLEFCLLSIFKLAKQSWFTIAVPLKNIEYIKGKLKFWHQSKDAGTGRDATLLDAGQKPIRLDTVYYKFTSFGLEIFTHQFSQFIITSERCDSFAELLVFVKMQIRERPVANFSLYLCSLYNENSNYRQVWLKFNKYIEIISNSVSVGAHLKLLKDTFL